MSAWPDTLRARLMAWERVRDAVEDRTLLVPHQHADAAILVDIVRCARCRAERELLLATVARLRLLHEATP